MRIKIDNSRDHLIPGHWAVRHSLDSVGFPWHVSFPPKAGSPQARARKLNPFPQDVEHSDHGPQSCHTLSMPFRITINGWKHWHYATKRFHDSNDKGESFLSTFGIVWQWVMKLTWTICNTAVLDLCRVAMTNFISSVFCLAASSCSYLGPIPTCGSALRIRAPWLPLCIYDYNNVIIEKKKD